MDETVVDTGVETQTEESEVSDGGFDVNDASDSLANDLFPSREEPREESSVEEKEVETETPEKEEEPQEEIVAKAPPASWKKEMHEVFAKLPKEAQDYIEQREQQMADGLEKDRGDANLGRVMRDTMAPYRAMLQAQGVDEPRAVQALMNAHYKLSNDSPVEKAKYFAGLAKSYGIDFSHLQQEQSQIDPTVKALQDELEGIKRTLSSGQQAAMNEAKTRVVKDVDAFASDPAHPYFDEVSDDIVSMIQAGHELKDAYEKAVWANPVTRQKEIARITQENEAKLREKSLATAKAAKAAASINIKTRDTSRTPTGPKGTMNDLDGALRETLREIKSRTH